MPNNEGIRRQLLPREVGGVKLWSHQHWTPLNWPRAGQKLSNSKQGPQCIMPPARRPNTTQFNGVTYFPRHGPIVYAVKILWNICRGKQPNFQVDSREITCMYPFGQLILNENFIRGCQSRRCLQLITDLTAIPIKYYNDSSFQPLRPLISAPKSQASLVFN